VHAGSGQLVDLVLGEHAQGAGDVEVRGGRFLADRLDASLYLGHQPPVRSAYGGDDAEFGRSSDRGLLGRLDQAWNVQPRRPNRRVKVTRLRAEVAILRAAGRLDADDALDFDLRTTPAHPHLVGQGEYLFQPIIR
jgi:hypothetical protein